MQEINHAKMLLIFALMAAASYAVYESQFAHESAWQFKPFTKGYALFDSQIQITDEKGKIHTSIESPEIIFYADSELTTIKEPVVDYYSSEVRWQLTSVEASINSEQSELFFAKDVSMVTLNQKDNTTINTSALTLFPELKKARTQAPIEWLQTTMTMKGKGSVIDLNLQEIEVLDEMHAEFNN